MTVKENAYAKLNISLDVGKKREDGYHDMVMVMQTVDIRDEVTVSASGSGEISCSCNFSYIPGDERNLAVKAAKLFLREAGEPETGLAINIRKTIPVGAGMAGGSSDAAAVLRAMNRMYGGRFSRDELERMAAEVGSDVAFCVRGGTVLAKGRGEILESLPPMPDCFITVCKPAFSISTPELFRKLDGAKYKCHPDTSGILAGLENEDLEQIARRMFNVFECADDRRLREVSVIKGIMLDHGALGSIMTGTGSAVFGVFREKEQADAAADCLARSYSFSRSCRPVGKLM